MNQPTGTPHTWPDPNELQALGRVVQAASTFEYSLQAAFCGLMGSKYAAVIVGAEQSSSLIEKGKALAKAQREISDSQMNEISAIFEDCAEANRKRNRLIHDVWAFGPDAATQQMRRQRVGYDITTRPITTREIEDVARALTTSAMRLQDVILNALGPERSNLEAQLRWEDHVASMSHQERIDLLWRRLAGMLGDLSRLLSRYGEQSFANWADRTRDNISGSPENVLDAINAAFCDEHGLGSVSLEGDPQGPVPPWLEGQDPNRQLAELLQQIYALSTYLRSQGGDAGGSQPGSDSGGEQSPRAANDPDQPQGLLVPRPVPAAAIRHGSPRRPRRRPAHPLPGARSAPATRSVPSSLPRAGAPGASLPRTTYGGPTRPR
jgi:hypothetical protein